MRRRLVASALLFACTGSEDPVEPAVTTPPRILVQPQDARVVEGRAATFTVQATGDGVTYQWKKDGVTIPRATASTFAIASVTPSDRGLYSVVVTNRAGAVTSRDATLDVGRPPLITRPLVDATARVGADVLFYVELADLADITFTWFRDDVAIEDVNSLAYTLSGVTLGDDGAEFSVRVENPYGAATSGPARLTVVASEEPTWGLVRPDVVGLAAGGVALRTDGRVCAWGGNSHGELGRGTTGEPSLAVGFVADVTQDVALEGVVRIAAGPSHVVALLNDSSVVTWGRAHALGAVDQRPAAEHSARPIRVRGVGGVGLLTNVVDVAAGEGVSAAVLDDGTLVTWGDNGNGALGIGTPVGSTFEPGEAFFPTPVPGVTGVVEVDAGWHRVFARTNDGAVIAFGSNAFGALGIGAEDTNTNTPQTVPGVSAVVRVVAGRDTTVALRADGTALLWGRTTWGTSGECGYASQTTPVAIARPTTVGSTFDAVGVDDDRVILTLAGTAYQVGDLVDDGEDGVCVNALTPVNFGGTVLGASRTFGASFLHLFGVDGRLFGLGHNANGELGVGDTMNRAAAREVDCRLFPEPPTPTYAFFTDFETGVPEEVATGAAFLTGVEGYAGLGDARRTFGGSMLRSATGNVVALTLTDLPAHQAIRLEFLFAAIDSLDGAGSFPAGDFLSITIDGREFFREAFANAIETQVQTYLPPPGVELARRVDLGFSGPGGHYVDSAYDFANDPRFAYIAHDADTLTVTFQIEGGGIQDLADESWAIDALGVGLYER